MHDAYQMTEEIQEDDVSPFVDVTGIQRNAHRTHEVFHIHLAESGWAVI